MKWEFPSVEPVDGWLAAEYELNFLSNNEKRKNSKGNRGGSDSAHGTAEEWLPEQSRAPGTEANSGSSTAENEVQRQRLSLKSHSTLSGGPAPPPIN